jgi:hypothetical protein
MRLISVFDRSKDLMRTTEALGIFTLTALAAIGCRHVAPLSNAYTAIAGDVGDRCMSRGNDGACEIFDVSLTELIAVPEKFHDKRVLVIGFITLAFEGNTVCPSEHSRSGKECLWLDVEGLKDPGFRKGYALIEGHFDGEGRGHLGCCSGAIDSISRFQRWR